jgi:hypothetical protein
MKKLLFLCLLSCISFKSYCWGFYAHQRINYFAVFLLPPEMLVLYKPSIQFLSDHSVDPDKRRYAVIEEAPRHYIDIDNYGTYPYDELPRRWEDAVKKYGEDTLQANGIVPWWIPVVQQRLTNAFKEKNKSKILKLSAEIGHYISDAHVPLHASSNHDGQHSNQRGIHGFWESRVPELLAEKEFDFMIGKAGFIADVPGFIWKRVLESGAASDTVLKAEAQLTKVFPTDKKYAFEERSGKVVRQYSSEFTRSYNRVINNMIERRMRQAIEAVASFWYTAWVNAGQPDLKHLNSAAFTEEDLEEFEKLNVEWRNSAPKGRAHE